jgi:hypothetical protein
MAQVISLLYPLPLVTNNGYQTKIVVFKGTNWCNNEYITYLGFNTILAILQQHYVKFIWYQFWCTTYSFRESISLQWCSGQKYIMVKISKNIQNFVKWLHISRKIELCIREIILRFELNSYNSIFSWQQSKNLSRDTVPLHILEMV